jgi:hypothetical protein
MKREIIICAGVLAMVAASATPSFAKKQKKAVESAGAVNMPRKVEMDRNYDGRIDRIEHYNALGKIIKIEADTTADGKMNEWAEYDKQGRAKSASKDTNGDGKPDTWVNY